MRLRRCISFIISSLFACVTLAQTLIINEVSNGPSGNMEYMELVVVSNAVSYNCAAPVPPCIDIRGWILDDNSGYHGGTVGTGVAPGAVRFSNDNFWSCIPLGTIIVIYNNADPNTSLPAQDLSMTDGNCLLVIPVNNPILFETNLTTPGAVACSYPLTGWTAGGNWNNIVLANSGDCMRIVDLAGCEVFSLCYGTANTNNLIYFAGSGADQVWYFNTGNPNLQANWTAGCADPTACGSNQQTPGAPNNALNASYIAQFNNGCQPITVLQSTLVSSSPAQCGCSGTATISSSGSISPYSYQWYTSAGNAIGQTSATATSLCPGNYFVVTTSGIACTDTVYVTIPGTSALPTITGSTVLCLGSSTQLNGLGTPSSLTPWLSSNLNVASISSSGIVTATGAGTTQITYTDNQGCQGTIQLTVNPLPSASISGGTTYCFGETVTLISATLTGNPNWQLSYTFNGTPTSINVSSSPVNLGTLEGTYVLTGISDANCPNSASGSETITIHPLPTASISGGGSYCAGESIGNISIALTGMPDWTLTYTFNGLPQTVGSITSSPFSLGNAPGNYIITGVTDGNMCANTASGDQQITVFPLPNASFSGGGTFCEGDPVVPISLNLSGSAPWTLTYNLDGQNMTEILSANSIDFSATGVYTFNALNDANCQMQIDTVIMLNTIPVPPAPITSSDTSYCIGDELAPMSVLSLVGMYTWFSDPELTNPIGNGVQLDPLEMIGTETYYIVNTQSECYSPPALISITISPCTLVIPTAFTPDFDGTNDWWEIPDIENYPNHVVSVYNRWGNLLYKSEKGNYTVKPWDGKYDDRLLPVASYYYIIDLDSLVESDELLKGTVSIVLPE